MRRLFALAFCAAAFLAAQSLDSLSRWQFFKEISVDPDSGIAALTLDSEVLAGARDDQGDLRIIDADGGEVPYDLRVLLGERNAETYEALEVSRGTEGDAAEITLDLGANPAEHNQVQVNAEGPRFRRQVSVFGSDDAEQWTPLTETGLILTLSANGKTAGVNRVPYPPSEFRYVRISVARDPQADAQPPVIESVSVQRATVIPGEEQEVPVSSLSKETIVEGQTSASRYTIELPGRVPLHALRFSTPGGPLVRTYQLLSVMDDNIAPVPISIGRIVRREGDPSTAITLRFQEAHAHRLQLTIAADAEPPLDILDPVVLSASRQLSLDLSAEPAQPMRLFYGNPAAAAPDYDINAELPHTLDETVPHPSLGAQQLNPNYVAPEPPLRESAPWLIYVLTAAASLGLLAILRSLVFDVGS